MRHAEPAVTLPDPGPSRLHDIIARIKDSYPSLSRAEQSVADAVLSNVQSAVDASNADLALRAGVSQPTVTRFCRSIGCDGVRDFKLQLARSLVVGELFLAADSPLAPVDPDNTPPFWASVLAESHLAIREVERQLAPAQVLAAAAILAPAHRVLTLGLGGSSSALAEETQNRLFRYGVPVTACKDPYLARMTVSTFRPDDVLIAISGSGRTREVIDCLDLARTYRARTIAITTPDSAVAQAAEIALTTHVGGYSDSLMPSASRFAFLTIIDLIAAATGYKMGPLARENLRRIKFNLVDKGAGPTIEPLGD
jgi:RpiR family transcriptional regulator, carbohydrate utilization regulator